jgi:hypothetical protein
LKVVGEVEILIGHSTLHSVIPVPTDTILASS